MPIGRSEAVTRRDVWLTADTIARVRQHAEATGLTFSRTLETLALEGLTKDRELGVGALVLAGVRASLDGHFFRYRKLTVNAASLASLVARLNEQTLELLIFERLRSHPDSGEADVVIWEDDQDLDKTKRVAKRLVKDAKADAFRRGMRALKPSLELLGVLGDGRSGPDRRARAGTERRPVYFTRQGLQAIEAFAEETGQGHFGAAVEMLVQLALGMDGARAASALVVANVREFFDEYFAAFRKLIAATGREVGIAAVLAEDALRLLVLKGIEEEAQGAQRMEAVLGDHPGASAIGRQTRQLRERKAAGAVRLGLRNLKTPVAETVAVLKSKTPPERLEEVR